MAIFRHLIKKYPYCPLSIEIGSLLIISFWAQYVNHIDPCTYCLYQRYIFIGALLFFLWTHRSFMGALCLGAGCILSLYHIGLEQHWWSDLLQRCLTPLSEGVYSPHNLREMIYKTAVVRCDTINWKIFGISSTLWTAVFQMIMLCQYFWIKTSKKP